MLLEGISAVQTCPVTFNASEALSKTPCTTMISKTAMNQTGDFVA